MLLSANLLLGQYIVVQSDNAADLKRYEEQIQSGNLKTLKNKLDAVIANYPDEYKNVNIIIQVAFYDSDKLINRLVFDSQIGRGHHDYLAVWKNKYNNEDRILFFFEKQNEQYVFKEFVVTQKISDGQLPDVVIEYINNQILKPEADPIKAVYKGINAVKNAYDRSFINKMQEIADRLIQERKYYKGYSFGSYPYYTLESEATQTILPYDFCNFYAYVSNGNFNVISTVGDPNDFSNNNATLSAVLTQKNLVVANINDIRLYSPITIDNIYVNSSNIYPYSYKKYIETGFTKENYVYAKNNAALILNSQKQIDKIIENPYTFLRWERGKINKIWTQVLIFSDDLFYCDQQYRVVYKKGMFTSGDQVDEINGISQWVSFTECQPTWCNQFARQLSKEIYNDKELWDANKTANALFKFFTNNFDYISLKDIKEENENNIWSNYVDKGFLVFYSKSEDGQSGHIETCFPNKNTSGKTYQKRYSGDTRYPNDNTPKPAGADKNLFIGAGGNVGYKGIDNDFRKNAEPFLFLGFLKMDF
jgi:hypothetical protein